MERLLLLKTHVSGYTNSKGTYVAPHEDKRTKQATKPKAVSSGTSPSLENKSSREPVFKAGDRVKSKWGDKFTIVGIDPENETRVVAQEDGAAHHVSFPIANIAGKLGAKKAPKKSSGADKITLYHGSAGTVTEITDGGVFAGLFASGDRNAALSHGENLHEISIEVKDLLTQQDINHNLDQQKVLKVLKSEITTLRFKPTTKQVERAYEVVMEDSQVVDDDLAWLHSDDIGEGSWKAQNLRGQVAKALGYKAVEMDDEHGTSYLVLPGVPVKPMGDDEHPSDDLAKSHVKGYSRKDGTYVMPHDRQGDAAAPVPTKPVQHHPRLSENGKRVQIHSPTHPSGPTTWHNPKAVATFVPNGDVPLSINGIQLRAWKDHPTINIGWDFVDGVNDAMHEPPFHLPEGKKASSGVVIEESDGRVWLIHPTNQFGGYDASFPKGTAEPELSLQGNALKECFEESGLQVEITGFLGDFERTTSVARMYKGRRTGGTPISAGWETQAVSLVPKEKMYDLLNMWPDHSIAESIGAGKAPVLVNKKDEENRL